MMAPKRTMAIEPLAPAQVLILADLIGPRYRAMVLPAAGCGLRWSEAAGLTRDRIHLGASARVIIDRQLAYRPATTHRGQEASSRSLFAPPKTEAARRVIPLPATVTAALRAHLRACPPGLLFTTPAGTVLNPANWRHPAALASAQVTGCARHVQAAPSKAVLRAWDSANQPR